MRIATLLATAVISVLAVSCSAGGSTPRSIVLLGDSITVFAGPDIKAALPRDHVTMLASAGAPAAKMAPYLSLELNAVPHPDVLFVNLGTDDALLNTTTWPKARTQVGVLARKAHCVVWVTVNIRADRGDRTAERWNATIRNRRHLIDWNTAVHADPRLLDWTGYHPSRAGDRWLGAHYAATAASC